MIGIFEGADMVAKYPLWVLLLIVPLYLCGLGNHALVEDNETRYAEISWEMASGGDWVTPRWNFIKHFDKPPVTYWLAAASMRAFGHNEFAVRLPSALAALIGLVLTFALGCRMLDPLAALLGTAALATSSQYWVVGNALLTDMPLTICILAALLCAWQVWHGEEQAQRQWRMLFWLSLAAGFMVKGPVALLVPALVILPYARLTKRPLSLWSAPYVCIAAVLGLTWYAVVVAQNPGLLRFFLVHETFDRVATTVHHRSGPIWFYLPALLTGFLPWTVLLVPAGWRMVVRMREGIIGSRSPELFLALWCVLPFIFFSCIGSKLPQYILPLWPALALAIGAVAAETWRGQADRCTLVALWGTGRLVGGMGLFALMYVSHGASEILAPAKLDVLVVAALLAAAGTGALFLCLRRGWVYLLVLLFSATWLVLAISCHALGRKDDTYSTRGVAEAVRKHQTAGTAVVMWGDYLSGLPFYLQQRIIQVGFRRAVQFEEPASLSGYYYPYAASFAGRQYSSEPLLVVVKKDCASECAPLRVVELCGPYALLGR